MGFGAHVRVFAKNDIGRYFKNGHLCRLNLRQQQITRIPIRCAANWEAVACKDWLTNKVDRCVTGRVAKQQCAGPLQIPLNNVGVMAMDYRGEKGIATSVGHSPVSALIDPVAGSQASIAEGIDQPDLGAN